MNLQSLPSGKRSLIASIKYAPSVCIVSLYSRGHLLHGSFPSFRDGARGTPAWSVAKPSLTAETVPEPPQYHINYVWGPVLAVAPASHASVRGQEGRRTLHAICSHSLCPGETEAKGKRTTEDLVTEPVKPSVGVGDLYPFSSQIEKPAVGSKK